MVSKWFPDEDSSWMSIWSMNDLQWHIRCFLIYTLNTDRKLRRNQYSHNINWDWLLNFFFPPPRDMRARLRERFLSLTRDGCPVEIVLDFSTFPNKTITNVVVDFLQWDCIFPDNHQKRHAKTIAYQFLGNMSSKIKCMKLNFEVYDFLFDQDIYIYKTKVLTICIVRRWNFETIFMIAEKCKTEHIRLTFPEHQIIRIVESIHEDVRLNLQRNYDSEIDHHKSFIFGFTWKKNHLTEN